MTNMDVSNSNRCDRTIKELPLNNINYYSKRFFSNNHIREEGNILSKEKENEKICFLLHYIASIDWSTHTYSIILIHYASPGKCDCQHCHCASSHLITDLILSRGIMLIMLIMLITNIQECRISCSLPGTGKTHCSSDIDINDCNPCWFPPKKTLVIFLVFAKSPISQIIQMISDLSWNFL